jgi:tellurite resistance protein TehA-like permease
MVDDKIMAVPEDRPVIRSQRDPLRAVTSNWFVIVMGLGGMIDAVAKVWGMTGTIGSWIDVAVWVNGGIFVVLIGIWLIRWFWAPAEMWREMTHPALGHSFALIPIAMTIEGLNWSLMGREFRPAVLDLVMNVAWILSIGFGILFSILITDAMMRQKSPRLEHVSFAWLLGSVATALFPLLGNVIVSRELHLSLPWVRFVNVVDIAFFGMGFFVFLFFTAFVMNRYFTGPEPPVQVTPTSWLLLGAAAVLSIGVLGLAESSGHVGLLPPSGFALLLGMALWGLAGWSFLLALTITLRAWFAGQLQFTLSW